ncbi:MAG: tetratricopeptide repeat protein [Planctomycetota bacterium]
MMQMRLFDAAFAPVGDRCARKDSIVVIDDAAPVASTPGEQVSLHSRAHGRVVAALSIARRLTLLVAVVAAAGLLSGCNGGGRGGGGSDRGEMSAAPGGRSTQMSAAEREAQRLEAKAFAEDATDALNEGDPERAEQAFTRALQVNPELIEARMGRGNLYRERGDYARAQRDFDQAAQIDPRNYDAHYFNGLMLQLLNRINEAIRAYRRAITILPDSHEANLNLAVAYLQASRPSEALPFAERAKTLLPDHGPTRANLGLTYAALTRHADAIDEYEAAVEMMEPSPELVLNLIESLKRERRFAEMANACEALTRDTPSPAAYERLGFAYFKLQRYQESEDAYRSAINLDADYYPAMNGVGVILLNRWIDSARTNRSARIEALEWLRRSLRVEPEQPKITQLITRYGS